MCFSIKIKTEGQNTHKQATTEGGCSQVQMEHLRKETCSVFGVVHGFQTSMSTKKFCASTGKNESMHVIIVCSAT